MEVWIIATKFIILFYCAIRYVLGEAKDIPAALLALLVYVSLSMLYYAFRRASLKKLFLFISVLDIILSVIYVNPLFALVLPVVLAEAVSVYSDKAGALILAAIAGAAITPVDILPEYLLSAGVSLVVILLAIRIYKTMISLKEENEKLRDKNDYLNGRLNAGTEYENQVRYLTQLEERNSLAQKLHDKLGHTLAGSLIQLEAALLVMEKDGALAGQMIRKITDHLKEGMESVRSTLRNIKPAAEQLGINRLKAMLDEFTLNNSISTELHYKGSLDVITHNQWIVIMDNVKEALTNAIKYSSATLVKVELEVMNRLVKVEVRDNGRGAYSYKKGLGIAGMEERTANIGGKLIIDGSKGFSIIMLVPVVVSQTG